MIKFVRIILYPFVLIYGTIVRLRNLFFDKGIFSSKSVDAKVISIGNLTVGGSGKTPAVIYTVKLLKEMGINTGVLSRGYGRKSSGYLLVSDGEKILTTVEKSGDEIYQTADECKAAAAVAENRVEGAKKLISETGVDTIVLDDAFQHRWINRDLNILIFDRQFLLVAGRSEQLLIPAGRMREHFSSVKRADAVIINRKFNSDIKELPQTVQKCLSGKPVFHAYYKAVEIIDIKYNKHYSLDDFKGQHSLVVCGIAKPLSFTRILMKNEIDIKNKLLFNDHAEYSQKEIQQIRKQFYSSNAYSVLTTQKDAVKLMKYSRELDDIDIFYLKIEMKIEEEEQYKNLIMKTKVNH